MIDLYPSDFEPVSRLYIRETQAQLVDRRMQESEARWAAQDAAMVPPGWRVPSACLPAGDYSVQDIANGRGGR